MKLTARLGTQCLLYMLPACSLLHLKPSSKERSGTPHHKIIHQGQSNLPVPAVRDSRLPAGALPLPFQKRGVLPQKSWQKHSHSKQSSLQTNKAATRGWGKKNQAFLSEQQLLSYTWSITAIFNKLLLFNIVYYKESIVILSWTMHTYALKSLRLSLKLGRIFQELYNGITSLTHSAPLQVVISATRYHEICFQELGDTVTQDSLYLCFFDRKSDLHKQTHNMHIKKFEY